MKPRRKIARLPYPVPPSADPPTLPGAKPPPSRGMVRQVIRTIVFVYLFCEVARTFFGDTFTIHSGSMEPTMVGSLEGGDRVVLSRCHFHFQEPARFEIISFAYPNNRATNYMKRLLGLPGEQLFIRGGDLYLADPRFAGTLAEALRLGRAAILRKPPRVQEGLLTSFPVIFPKDLEDLTRGFPMHFDLTPPDAGAWSVAEEEIGVTSETATLATTKREIRDVLHDFGSKGSDGLPAPTGVGGQFPAGDLSFRVAFRPRAGAGAAVLVLMDATHDLVVRAEVAVRGSGLQTRILLGDRVLGTSAAGIAPGSWSDLRLDNIDDRIRLVVDGDEVLARDYSHEPVEKDRGYAFRRPAAAMGITGGAFDLRPQGLCRDIYWVQEGQDRFLIPPDHYLVLGDNSPQSSDSRQWKRTAIQVQATGEILEGDSHGVTVEDLLLHDANPWQEVDGTRTFSDLHGNKRSFESSEAYRVLGTWPTPYVPRDLVEGKAMLLLAPLRRARWFR